MHRRATLFAGIALGLAAVVLLKWDWASIARPRAPAERDIVLSNGAPAELATSDARATNAERALEPSPPDEASANEAPAETVHVEGTVRTRDGAIVTNGEVVLRVVDFREWDLDPAGWAALDADGRLERQYPVESAAIGPEGRFSAAVPVPGVLCTALMKPLVSSRDVEFLESEIELGELLVTRESVPTLDLRVDAGGSLSGIVVDAASGAPIEGARVTNPWWHDLWSEWGSTTDVDGRFRIAGIDPVVAVSGGAELEVRAEGYVARRVRTPAPEVGVDVSGIRIELERGVVVRGRCTGSRTGEKRDLDLVLYAVDPKTEPSAIVRRVSFLAETRTQNDGAFAFPAVPAVADARLEIENVVPPLEGRSLDLRQQQPELLVEVPETLEWTLPRAAIGSDAIRRGIDLAFFEPRSDDRPLAFDRSSPVFARVDEPIRIFVFALGDDAGPSVLRREYVRVLRETLEQQERDHLAADELVAETVTKTSTMFGRVELTVNDDQGRPISGSRISYADSRSARHSYIVGDAEGRVVVPVDLGRRFVSIRVAGFETEILEVRARDLRVASLELTLRPLSP